MCSHLVEIDPDIGDVSVLEEDLSILGPLEEVHGSQNSRRPRAGRADHDYDLTLLDGEVDALQNVVITEPLVDVLEPNQAHPVTPTRPLRSRLSTAFTSRIIGRLMTR